MVSNAMVFRAAKTLVTTINKVSDETLPAKIAASCKHCAVTAAVAAFFIGWLPVAGAAIATIVSAVAVWTMYVKINTAIQVPFSRNLIKSILIAIGTNLMSYVVTVFVATLISFIPAIGSLAAAVAMAVATYAITLAAAYVYLNILARVFGKTHELKPFNKDGVVSAMRPAIDDVDVRTIVRATRINGNRNNER